jgi:hypothetical protein
LSLPLPLKGTVAKRGQAIFLDNNLGKCNICHRNAGANALLGPTDLGNANFDTGVEALPDQPARLTAEKVPVDDGFGVPGDKTFNVPPIVEAAGSGAFFHNNSVSTIDAAVGFYDGDSFNNSPSGLFLKSIDPEKKGIELDATQLAAITAFLRVINAIENIRQSTELLNDSAMQPPPRRESAADLLKRARSVVDTAARVLAEGGLHPQAVTQLRAAQSHIARAAGYHVPPRSIIDDALRAQDAARAELIEGK